MKSLGSAPFYAVFIVLVPLLAFSMHYMAGMHFPHPSHDEARFFYPSYNFYKHWSLSAPELNAPDGMFWMQDGYYIILGLVSHITGPDIRSFRHLSFGFSLVFYFGLLFYCRKVSLLKRSYILPVIWLLAPITIALGNFARMEALIAGLSGLVILSIVQNRYVLAFCLTVLSGLVHPIGMFVAGVFFLFLLAEWRSLSTTGALHIGKLEVSAAFATSTAVALQAVHWILNWSVLLPHMEHQFRRKIGQDLVERFTDPGIVFLGLSICGLVGVYLVGLMLRDRPGHTERSLLRIKGLLVLSFALAFFALYGAEMAYALHLYVTSPILSLVALFELVMLTHRRVRDIQMGVQA